MLEYNVKVSSGTPEHPKAPPLGGSWAPGQLNISYGPCITYLKTMLWEYIITTTELKDPKTDQFFLLLNGKWKGGFLDTFWQ